MRLVEYAAAIASFLVMAVKFALLVSFFVMRRFAEHTGSRWFVVGVLVISLLGLGFFRKTKTKSVRKESSLAHIPRDDWSRELQIM